LPGPSCRSSGSLLLHKQTPWIFVVLRRGIVTYNRLSRFGRACTQDGKDYQPVLTYPVIGVGCQVEDNSRTEGAYYPMGEKILLVEDHHGTRKNLSRFLDSQGYSVIEARDGLEALTLLSKNSIDIVISDFVLPKIHGLTLVREIRSRWPRMAVIIMSAYLAEAAGRVILEPEAEFLAKPLELNDLAAKVYGAVLRKELHHS
jgi:CheY-like chemotaxis protein